MSRIAFHIHSSLSRDCSIPLQKIRECLKVAQIDAFFLTDHNVLPSTPLPSTKPYVLKGEEINTSEGEIIGVFLSEKIPQGMSAGQTLKEIHRQGGISVVPHPFDRLRRKVITPEALQKNIREIDVVEIFNSRTLFSKDNDRACALARKNKKPMIYGSDAHTQTEYGKTWMDNVDIRSPRTFLESLSRARAHTFQASWFVHLITVYDKQKKRYHS